MRGANEKSWRAGNYRRMVLGNQRVDMITSATIRKWARGFLANCWAVVHLLSRSQDRPTQLNSRSSDRWLVMASTGSDDLANHQSPANRSARRRPTARAAGQIVLVSPMC
jgi:hypothetical protein